MNHIIDPHYTTYQVIFQIIKSHHGDCRGAVVSKIQSSDGNCVTREAKLSIHESPHEHHYELERLNQETDLCPT